MTEKFRFSSEERMTYKYRVMIQGSGFELKFEHMRGRYGFVTTRYVEAEGITSAEAIAIESVKEELVSQLDFPSGISNPMRAILIEELDEESEMPDVGGFTWFPDENCGGSLLLPYKYRVIVDGSGFELKFEHSRGRTYGFTTTRYVEAEGITSAEAIAIESVKEELASRLGFPSEISNPMRAILIEELDEESEMPDVGGFTWSPDENYDG